MKRIINSYSLILALISGALLMVGCNSPQEKVESAKENLEEAKQDLAKARADSIAAEEEWHTFRNSCREEIAANKALIVELRAKKKAESKMLDPVYEKKIADLEARNDALEARIADYEKYHSDWEIFKREFKHDMEELGKALKDLTVDNTK